MARLDGLIDLLQKIFWHQKMLGDLARKTAVYLDIHEDLSTRSTTQIWARGAFAVSLLICFTNGCSNNHQPSVVKVNLEAEKAAVHQKVKPLSGSYTGKGKQISRNPFLPPPSVLQPNGSSKKVSAGLKTAMKGLDISEIPEDQMFQERGW